jgi:hypothetical protein
MQHQLVTLHLAKQLITVITSAEREEEERSPSTLQGHMAPRKRSIHFGPVDAITHH